MKNYNYKFWPTEAEKKLVKQKLGNLWLSQQCSQLYENVVAISVNFDFG